MPRISSITDRNVFAADGKPLGVVSAVLFDAGEPRVVGIEVRPRPIAYVVPRRPRYVPIGDVALVGESAVRLPGKRLPSDDAGEKAIGRSWHDTVIWRGMPVVSAEGEPVGAVHDVAYSAETLRVTRLIVSTGMFGDAALGRLEVGGEFVRGFDGDRVIVLPGYRDIRATGGVAKAAATGVAAVKVRGERVATEAVKAGAAAAAAVGRSFKHGAGRRAIDRLKSLMDDEE